MIRSVDKRNCEVLCIDRQGELDLDTPTSVFPAIKPLRKRVWRHCSVGRAPGVRLSRCTFSRARISEKTTPECRDLLPGNSTLRNASNGAAATHLEAISKLLGGHDGNMLLTGSTTSRLLAIATLIPALCFAACWRDSSCTGPLEPAFPGPWDAHNFAPKSRVITPRSILSLPREHIADYSADEDGISLGSDIEGLVLDFGVEVGGLVSLDYTLSGSENATLGLAFTEAKDYIGRKSDNSNGGEGQDGALLHFITSAGDGHYTMPDPKLRGGFRYLTIFLESSLNATLDLTNISLEISFQPTWPNLRAYQGYFHSSEELLDRIWYSGAYTLQTNSVPGHTGRVSPESERTGWQNDEHIGPGDTVLLDGAKRDRWVWIGDMGTAVPSAAVSTGDLESTKNALLTIYDNQDSNGALPKAGPPNAVPNSDTYHLWALIGTYNYYLHTQDDQFLGEVWAQYVRAFDNIMGKIDSDGIVNVTGENDWGRWTYSAQRASASMLLYRALETGCSVASWAPTLPNAKECNTKWTAAATKLQAAITEHFWDEERGVFVESPDNTTLYPQDANSMAIAFGVLSPHSKEAQRVSDYLHSNWTPIGPSSPELENNVSPFISSIELEGHFKVGRPERSLELMRTTWGWYLEHPNGTQSTVPEGYLLDGTWGYRGDRGYRNDPSYMSHAHCWSSGPTSTLTEYMVGLRLTGPRGSTWQLTPASFNELSEAEAGFTTSLGKFSARFEVKDRKVLVKWDTPQNTVGYVALPGNGGRWVKGGRGSTTVSI